MRVDETVTYLEMTDRGQLRPVAGPPLEIRRAEIPCPELNRFLYTAVGGRWRWTDRLGWTYAQWLAMLSRPGFETWVAYVRGTPAGYFELDGPAGGDVEIASFGLLPAMVGQGLGGRLLTLTIERAWDKAAARVWLHTSSLDHPRALPNYLARGFCITRAETFSKEVPDEPLGPWPGAE